MNSIDQVHDFWNENSCGEIYAKGRDQAEKYATETKTRYLLEPYIKDFAEFESYEDLNVLEIGIGMGSDHSSIAYSNPKSLILKTMLKILMHYLRVFDHVFQERRLPLHIIYLRQDRSGPLYRKSKQICCETWYVKFDNNSE